MPHLNSWFTLTVEIDMEQRKSVTAGILLLAGAVAATNAFAYSEIADEVGREGNGFVGLGIGSVPDYEGSDTNKGTVAPFGRYNWASGRYISLGGTANAEQAARLKMNLLTKDTPWELGPVLQYRAKRDNVDNNRVDRMREVDAATEAGAFLGWKADRLSLSTTYVTDVSDEHSGDVWYLNGYYDIPVDEHLKLALGAYATWASDDYMETYFGVNGNDSARSGLPVYKAESGFKDTGLILIGHYKFNKSWGMAGVVNYTRMLNDAEDSPLVKQVGDENQYKALVAVTYSF
jgi:outer membrane scaffolding protein for murein synthesis (MipA/OmpV family)